MRTETHTAYSGSDTGKVSSVQNQNGRQPLQSFPIRVTKVPACPSHKIISKKTDNFHLWGDRLISIGPLQALVNWSLGILRMAECDLGGFLNTDTI